MTGLKAACIYLLVMAAGGSPQASGAGGAEGSGPPMIREAIDSTRLSPAGVEMKWLGRSSSQANRHRPPRPPEPSLLTLPFRMAIRFFQKFISPMDGPTCPMHPTCSRYAIESINKHGVFFGLFMTTDRLIRDNGDYRHYPRVRIHGLLRYHDPVEANDFWFDGKHKVAERR